MRRDPHFPTSQLADRADHKVSSLEPVYDQGFIEKIPAGVFRENLTGIWLNVPQGKFTSATMQAIWKLSSLRPGQNPSPGPGPG